MTNLNPVAQQLTDTIENATSDALNYIATLRRELDQIEERMAAGYASGHTNPETLRLVEALTVRDSAMRLLKAVEHHAK